MLSSFVDKLVRVAGNLQGASVLEVGPGPGAITRSILSGGPQYTTVVEKDRRFLPSLEVGLVGHASRGRGSVESRCVEYAIVLPTVAK